MSPLRTLAQTLGSIAITGLVIAAPLPAMAQAANPCAPKSSKGKNPCAATKASNPCAGKKGPCAPKK